MAVPAGDMAVPLLNLTPDEKRVYSQLFQQADTDRLGVVTGEIAVKFFEKTKLPPDVLGEIWQIADQENRGLLTKAGFCMAMRLIGQAQSGSNAPLDVEHAFKPGPLPRFDGINLQPSSPAPATLPPPQLQAQVSGIRIPPLLPEKAAQYSGLFDRSGAQNGILSGEMAKAIFERAGLPNETLGKIWGLADREQKGALDITEFIIAMHLITSFKSRNMTALPSALPPALYEAASRRGQPAPRQVSVSTGSQRLNAAPQRTGSPLTRGPYNQSPIPVQTTGQNWLVSPAEKAKYDQFFDNIDTDRTGFINGEQAVNFFQDSGLPEDALASIWDLADIRSEGRLSRDEFAVAMYLIRQQRSGAPLPAFLPAALIPPSMRGPQQQQQQQPQQPQQQAPPPAAAPKFNPPVQAPKSAADDLFGLDSSPPKPAAPQNVQTTGGSFSRTPFDNDPFGDKAAAFTPQSTGPTQQSSMFKPFQPTSAFGASIATQNTGGSVTSPVAQNRGFQPTRPSAPPKPADDDLLGDHDEEQSKKLTEETTELANMSTQVGNLRTQMQDVQAKKSTNEREVSAASSQKLELQQRLQQFRAQYEQEVAAVKSLEQQLHTLRTENQKMQSDLAMIEGTHSDLQTQHAQIAQALEADRTENSNLKSRISELNTEIAQLKPQIEKMKSEARQQKGLVAINKKQLATNETERDRLNGEISDLKAEELERSRSAAASPASVTSPGGSTHTNPFYRNMTPAGVPEGVQSPTTNFMATAPSPSAFDALFGPAASKTGAQSAFPPPATSFHNESEAGQRSMTPDLSTMSPPQHRNLSPSRGEPPPPPESRQFTPRMLPVHTGGSFAGSTTSSTRVAPSAAGAIDGINTPRPEGPGDFVRSFGAPPPAFPEGLLATSAIPAAHLDIPRSSAPTSASTPLPEDIPGAFPTEKSPEKKSSPPLTTFAAAPAQPDFDSAFEGFGNSTEHSASHDDVFGEKEAPQKANEDFYPMTAPAEESDSSDEEDEVHHSGPSAAAHNGVNGSADKAVEHHEPTAESSSAVPPIAPITIDTTSVPPPSFDQQKSPPVYSPRENTEPDFPDEFHGLLPARSDPTQDSHLHSVPSNPQQTAHEDPWTEVNASTASVAPAEATTAVSSVTFPEDDFAEFNDLAEAKQHTADDRFDFNEDRSELEFNPNFDSPAASMTTAAMSASHQATPTAGNSFHTFGTGSASDFGNFGQASAAPSNHDWDAIFSGLDAPSTPKLSNLTAPGAAPAQQPTLDRSMSTSSEHDDPILQRLVGMGYSRSQALGALEKYDYDINKAVEHLTSSS